MGQLRAATATAAHDLGRIPGNISGVESPPHQVRGDHGDQNRTAINHCGQGYYHAAQFVLQEVAHLPHTISAAGRGLASHHFYPINVLDLAQQLFGLTAQGGLLEAFQLFFEVFILLNEGF